MIIEYQNRRYDSDKVCKPWKLGHEGDVPHVYMTESVVYADGRVSCSAKGRDLVDALIREGREELDRCSKVPDALDELKLAGGGAFVRDGESVYEARFGGCAIAAYVNTRKFVFTHFFLSGDNNLLRVKRAIAVCDKLIELGWVEA